VQGMTTIPNHPFPLEYPATIAKPHPVGDGMLYQFEFPNGYGASVVRFSGSYGNQHGLWEFAVRHHGGLCYSTAITDNVIGYLSEAAVAALVERVRLL